MLPADQLYEVIRVNAHADINVSLGRTSDYDYAFDMAADSRATHPHDVVHVWNMTNEPYIFLEGIVPA